VANLVKAGLHLRAAQLEKLLQGQRKYGTMAKLALEVTTAAAITIAIIGGTLAQAAFALATPLLVVSAIATKMLMDLYETGFHLLQALKFKRSADPLQQAEAADHVNSAKAHALNALTSATVAGGFSLLVFSGFGLLGVSLATAATIVGAVGAAYFKSLRAPATLVTTQGEAISADPEHSTSETLDSSHRHTARLLSAANNVTYGVHTETFSKIDNRPSNFVASSTTKTTFPFHGGTKPLLHEVPAEQLRAGPSLS
jgi:hypothetical protein